MTHTLQVSFRKLEPSESLIALAADHYRRMQTVLQGSGECVVSLETRQGPQRNRAYAVVRVEEDGRACAQATASHKNARVALHLALADVHMQLGVPSTVSASEGRTRILEDANYPATRPPTSLHASQAAPRSQRARWRSP